MEYNYILVKKEAPFLRITLNRPHVRNAMNRDMVIELLDVFKSIHSKKEYRAIFINGSGPIFSSGADINWLKSASKYTYDENINDLKPLSELFDLIETCPCPVVTAIHGYVVGGALGLVCASDYVIAEETTLYSLSEVTLGIVPAIVGPLVFRTVGTSWAKAFFLNSEHITTEKAHIMGLVHEHVSGVESLELSIERIKKNMKKSSPNALKEAKYFLNTLPSLTKEKQQKLAIETLAKIRTTTEAQEGMAAFLEKRSPSWSPRSDKK